MGLAWVGTPNFEKGREGHAPTDIVLHWMDGTLAGADARFANPAEQVSATYGIENTTEHQYVQIADTSWNSGSKAENLISVSIEHSAAPGRPASAATIATSVNRMVTLIRTVPTLSVDRIWPHNRFYATECPGTLPVAAMIAAVRTTLHGNPAPTPAPPNGPPYIGYPVWEGHCSAYLTKMIQTRLSIPADGIWGPITDSAVRGFQRSHGLTVDGIVGPQTWSELWG
jgi:peptidoglycan hydrolase-like protein with peptidoglycan-binding domain